MIISPDYARFVKRHSANTTTRIREGSLRQYLSSIATAEPMPETQRSDQGCWSTAIKRCARTNETGK
jgi:hypothetical protein